MMYEKCPIHHIIIMFTDVAQVFDKEEGNWHVHLRGAKDIVQRQRFVQKQDFDSDFLLTWLLYHDVLAAFTRPSWATDTQSVGQDPLCLLQSFGGNKSLVSHLR